MKETKITSLSRSYAYFRRVAKVYGFSMNEKKNVMTCAGNITIVYTSEFFQPDVEELDDSYIFVGPSITSRKDMQEITFKQKEEEKLIYISMGTVFNQQMDFYYICFEAFKIFLLPSYCP